MTWVLKSEETYDPYDFYKKMQSLKTRIIVLIALQFHRKLDHIVKFVQFYKRISYYGVVKSLTRLRDPGFVRRVGRGKYVITERGLRLLRFYWLKGLIPNEYITEKVLAVRVKKKVVKEDGTVDYIYL